MTFTPKPVPLNSNTNSISQVMNINFQLLSDSIKELENKLRNVNDLAKKKTSFNPTFGDVIITGDLEVDGRDVLRYMYTVAAGTI